MVLFSSEKVEFTDSIEFTLSLQARVCVANPCFVSKDRSHLEHMWLDWLDWSDSVVFAAFVFSISLAQFCTAASTAGFDSTILEVVEGGGKALSSRSLKFTLQISFPPTIPTGLRLSFDRLFGRDLTGECVNGVSIRRLI